MINTIMEEDLVLDMGFVDKSEEKGDSWMSTLMECECVKGKAGNKSEVSELLAVQSQLKHELEAMIVTLANKDVEIARLKVKL
ncbi:hypothetical protein MTR67_039950 [Solanum verrucosum]|uniref:Uncharacterized protein n=1 Tax=Solanum verrucosum TaxID=315347 RepID=A0AAF0ZR80_SOLVR|nr:hypothetical protein MTR67_039950 [Solanum verrucosum]